MSIVIRGMEMPENCGECPCLRHDSTDGVNAYQCNLTFNINPQNMWTERGKDCPLVALPEKHGRLADADALIERRKGCAFKGDITPIIEYAQTIEPETEEEAYERGYTAGQMAERKKGTWIYGESEIGNDGYYCSVCGNFVPWKYGEYDIDFIQEFLYCNKCGSDMRGE